MRISSFVCFLSFLFLACLTGQSFCQGCPDADPNNRPGSATPSAGNLNELVFYLWLLCPYYCVLRIFKSLCELSCLA
jgi:hypothetical protein